MNSEAAQGVWIMVRARLRANRMSLIVMAVLVAVLCTSQLQAYVSVFPDKATRAATLAPIVNNAALRVLYGYPYDIADPAGWVAWRTMAGVITAVWAAVITAGALRGEEEAGRGELVLSGLQPRRRWFAAALTATAVQTLVIGAVTVAALAADGLPQHLLSVANCLEIGLQLMLPALLFAAVAALTSQLAETVRGARLLAIGILVAAFIVRAPADIGAGIAWLRWCSPLGWFEMLRPPAGPPPVVLAAIVAGTVAPVLIALPMLSRRDLGRGMLPERDSRPPRRLLLAASWQVALRDEAAQLAFWLIGTLAYATLMGSMVKTMLEFMHRTPVYARFFGEQLAVNGFVVAFYSLIQLIAALLAVTLTVGARSEESTGRLELVLAMPRSRIGWLCGRALLATAMATAVDFLAAVAIWGGAAATGQRIGFGSLLAAAGNSVPLIVVTVGGAVAVFAVAPRAVSFVYAMVATAFLWDALGSALKAPEWSLNLTPFHALARVPMQHFAATPAAVVTAIGVALFGLALLVFRRRDLAIG
jgi:ABC-2 type transport system permease protein